MDKLKLWENIKDCLQQVDFHLGKLNMGHHMDGQVGVNSFKLFIAVFHLKRLKEPRPGMTCVLSVDLIYISYSN